MRINGFGFGIGYLMSIEGIECIECIESKERQREGEPSGFIKLFI